jgi:BirA family biotin operon repressor/biotin-[acetyl-CoA-carboxylase] ligase
MATVKEQPQDTISFAGIAKFLDDRANKFIKAKIIDKTTSTNDIIKEYAANGEKEGFLLVSGEQTNGKGRMGRSFFSPGDTGVYMSLLLRPKIKPADAVLITTAAAVSVCEAFEKLGVDNPQIKWVNDIFVNNKKVCGILTEASFGVDINTLDYAVLGIGVNMYEPENSFPEEIKDIAGAVFSEKSENLRNKFVAYFINSFFDCYENLESKKHCPSYAERCFVIGKDINVISGDSIKPAKALSVDENCGLLVRFNDGETAVLNSGEISVRTV